MQSSYAVNNNLLEKKLVCVSPKCDLLLSYDKFAIKFNSMEMFAREF